MYDVIKYILFIAILVFASISDIKTRRVSDLVHLLIFAIAFIGFDIRYFPSMLCGLIIVPLPFLISAMLKENSIGGADIKITAVSSFFLGFERGLTAVIIGLFVGILVTVIKRKLNNEDIKDKFPMIPCIAFGSFLTLLIN